MSEYRAVIVHFYLCQPLNLAHFSFSQSHAAPVEREQMINATVMKLRPHRGVGWLICQSFHCCAIGERLEIPSRCERPPERHGAG
jgi:hypothetical protein